MEKGGARCNVLEAVDLVLILNFQLQRLELVLEVAERHDLAGVVRGQRGAPESLAQDLVAGPDALGVEGGREELALSLRWSALSAECVGGIGAYPH
jgi:hypothetical protein